MLNTFVDIVVSSLDIDISAIGCPWYLACIKIVSAGVEGTSDK